MQKLGAPFFLTGSTGIMVAALAADSIVFAMKAAASDTTKPNIPPRGPIAIHSLKMTYTAIVASAAVVLGGRGLRIFRGTNDAAGKTMPTGGTALAPVAKSTLDAPADTGLDATNPARISTTAGLTVGSFTRSAVPMGTFDLVSGGSIGSRLTFEYSEEANGSPLYVAPGEILCVSNPAIFDALLTWQLTIDIDYRRMETM